MRRSRERRVSQSVQGTEANGKEQRESSSLLLLPSLPLLPPKQAENTTELTFSRTRGPTLTLSCMFSPAAAERGMVVVEAILTEGGVELDEVRRRGWTRETRRRLDRRSIVRERRDDDDNNDGERRRGEGRIVAKREGRGLSEGGERGERGEGDSGRRPACVLFFFLSPPISFRALVEKGQLPFQEAHFVADRASTAEVSSDRTPRRVHRSPTLGFSLPRPSLPTYPRRANHIRSPHCGLESHVRYRISPSTLSRRVSTIPSLTQTLPSSASPQAPPRSQPSLLQPSWQVPTG